MSIRSVALYVLLSLAAPAAACMTDADCACDGSLICADGACVPAFTLATFPIGLPGASPWTTPIIAVLDHAGGFYTGCCDTRITAFTGETAERNAEAVLCPSPPAFPDCLFATCLCGYGAVSGRPFVVNGSYVGVVGPTHLQYDGHAGYDYQASAGTPLVATRAGTLCKAVADPVNGTAAQPTAWDGFHTFYVDHGTVAGFGWSSWYLHATDLVGALAGLAPGACAPVAEGEVIATAGATGTLVPHLHFEVRRYAPGDGPESAAAKIVDPYGWRGAEPDPWSAPDGNPQAASLGPALWRGCGNGRIECAEHCDSDPCCPATCEAPTPRAACRRPVKPRAATLQLRAATTTAAARAQWKWTRGAATAADDFATPATSTGYRVCVFREDGPPTLVAGAAVPAGGACGTRGAPCWKGLGSPVGSRGQRYRDRDATPNGITRLDLKPGSAGAAKIVLDARGPRFALPPLPLGLPLRVQLSADGGTCWEARYDANGVRRNDGTRFQARGD